MPVKKVEMEQKSEIMDELQQIGSILAGRGVVHPFSVPSGYFERLPVAITAYVIDETRLLSSKTPYTLPGNYFDRLPASIISRITLAQTEIDEELSEIAPLLRSIHKKEVYATPQGYFDQPLHVPALAKNEPAKIIGFKKYRRLIQYAAAAVFGGLLVSGAFMFTDSKDYIRSAKPVAPMSKQEPVPAANIAPVNEVVIEKESDASVQKAPFAKKVELLSDDELQNYLEENAPTEPIQIIEDTSEEVTTI